MKTKVCSTCNIEKEVIYFYKYKKSLDGHASVCKECKKEYLKKYREENKKRIAEQKSKYYSQNKEKINTISKDYYCNNKQVIHSQRNERLEKNPLLKMSCLIRAQLYTILHKKPKKSKYYKIIGCSSDELLNYLNDNPYGFSYEDEDIELDHIISLSTANTEEEILELNHYSNLQLLPSDYNRYIKKDNPFDKEHFENWLEENQVLIK